MPNPSFGDFRFPPDVLSILSAFVDPLGGSAPEMDRDDMESWLSQRERALEDYLSRIGRGVNPVGALICGVWTTAPDGYLLCSGADYSPTQYEDLFSVCGYTFGANGANFKVPDLRGRMMVGVDAMGGTAAVRVAAATIVGQASGQETRVLDANNLPAHTHTYWDNTVTGWFGVSSGSSFSCYVYPYQGDSARTTSSAGSNTAFATMNPYMAVNIAIKT